MASITPSDSVVGIAATYLAKVVDWDGVSQDVREALASAFEANDYSACIKDLSAKGIRPMPFINNLNKIIEDLPDDPFRRQCVRALRKTCGLNGIYPDCYTYPHPLKKVDELPIAYGGSCTVWKFTRERGGPTFAVKVLHVSSQHSIKKIHKRYCKEVVIWKRMEHPNILNIEGVAPHLFPFCMVSDWMENGDMLKYVKNNPDADRFGLLLGVTRGLGYLHSNEVVHGDLKGENIVIDQKRNPRLTDFGLSSITRDVASANASTPNSHCTFCYCAPELFCGETSTYGSDIYSLSMVIVELVTGRIPFSEIPFSEHSHLVVLQRVLAGGRPPKPLLIVAPGMTPQVWDIAERCWHGEAQSRPDAKVVLQELEDMKAKTGDEQAPSTVRTGDEQAPSTVGTGDEQTPSMVGTGERTLSTVRTGSRLARSAPIQWLRKTLSRFSK